MDYIFIELEAEEEEEEEEEKREEEEEKEGEKEEEEENREEEVNLLLISNPKPIKIIDRNELHFFQEKSPYINKTCRHNEFRQFFLSQSHPLSPTHTQSIYPFFKPT